jgi:predicted nucleic acid-binding protein
MAKVKILVDTDIIIDCLKGVKSARDLFRSDTVDIYCSTLSRKELLSMPGLRDAERKRITELLSKIRVLRIDSEIHSKYMQLLSLYGERQASLVDYIIAATAWAKNFPLMTRNRKHFKHIEEIELCPVYEDAK